MSRTNTFCLVLIFSILLLSAPFVCDFSLVDVWFLESIDTQVKYVLFRCDAEFPSVPFR